MSGRSLAALFLAMPVAAQQFSDGTADIPQGSPDNSSLSEQVDFADVDLDGDWDAAFADGGDFGNDQNRLWINQGGDQGGTVGVFVDETSARFPAVLDTSRDLEFADFDADGDVDAFVANDSQLVNQPSRFWINSGPAAPGVFVDETHLRWLNLGVNDGETTFSSIPALQVLPGGGYIDFSDDADFADLDNDGDLDLVLSSHGGAYGGQAPTRIFLNDGNGFFEELNPSGEQLPVLNIANGTPGLWCQGVHQSDTTDTTGVECDVALSVVDLELADTDGDLDIDMILGDLLNDPRHYTNLLEETGTLVFRDTSHAVFPPNWAPGSGHYEQELGDLDNDGDLDLYGVNWAVLDGQYLDTVLENLGGTYAAPIVVPLSQSDDEEADFLDYDSDGDLDVFVANFSGQDGLIRNDGGFTFVNASNELPEVVGLISHDGEVADVDADGDPDVFTATGNTRNLYYQNAGAPDTFAPSLYRLEQVAGGPASTAPRIVRVQVYDNQPYYATWYDATELEVTVDGGPPTTFPMTSSGGQIFRGEIPGNLVGTVAYRALSTDEHGNQGASATLAYVATPGACDSLVAVYCTAKTNSQGCVPAVQLAACVSASDPAPATVLGSSFLNARNGLLFYGFAPAALPFQGGTLCVSPPLRRTPIQNAGGTPPPATDCTGVFALDANAWVQSGADALLTVGTTFWAQWWARDPADAQGVSLSDAVQATVEP